MTALFESFLSSWEAQEAFSERKFVEAMLRFEAALARSQATVGLIPESSAQSIVGTCKVELFDVPKVVRESGRAGSAAIPLIRMLKGTVALFNPEAAAHVHFGSTSQDVIDTAMALLTRDALQQIERDLDPLVDALLALAERHAATPMLARTLLQPASVTSLGLKCAGWAAPLLRSRRRLREGARQALQLQLGGSVGTLAEMGARGAEVATLMARELGLAVPAGPWHTQRDEWVALGCELGILTGSLGKIAKDMALLNQYEVGEVMEPAAQGRGGSSSMPHKRNPAAAMVALAAAQRAPQRVAALLACMPQEHERSLGLWQAELAEWPQLLMSAHGSVRALAEAVPGLRVDAQRMRANLDSVRSSQPDEAARAWFAPELAEHAGRMAQAQACAMRREMQAQADG